MFQASSQRWTDARVWSERAACVATERRLTRRAELGDGRGDARGAVAPGAIQATFPTGRGQKVRYERRGEHYLFTSRVATEAHLEHLSWTEIAKEVLLRNRITEVVAFGIRDWHAVEAWVEQRASTLRTAKLKFYIAQLAREADRFEYLLTGKDVH